VRNKEVPLIAKEERNVPHIVNGREANCIGHILHGSCLLRHVIEGNIQRDGMRSWKT
jgi:hypothetical protein